MNNPLSKAWQWVKRKVLNTYEAASSRFSGERSLLFSNVQDAHRDIDAATRKELVRLHRYWVKNSSIVQRIRALFIQFSVGATGLQCIPNSADEDWNEVRMRSWENWCRNPEINSRLTIRELCQVWAGALFDDGAPFILKLQERGRLWIQTIEAHRCQTPPSLKDQEGKTIVDGVEVDERMRPIAYWFVDVDDGSYNSEKRFRRYPAEMVIHRFKVRRPGQIRELPEGVSGYNVLHDYEDLHKLEMQAAKRLASIANVVYNESGEADTTNSRRGRLSYASQNSAGAPVTKDRSVYYENTLGSGTVYAQNGEKIEQFKIDRPSIAVQSYWDLKLSEICCAYNVPKLLVVPYSLQGTVTRADLDVCTTAFRFNFEIIASILREIYEWHTEWAIRYDRTMDGKPPEQHLEVVIRPPRQPNVDVGYSADAVAKEIALGTVTYQDIFAERQQDWRQQFRQAAEAEFFKRKLAAEFSKEGVELKPEDIAKKIDQMASGNGDKGAAIKSELDAYGVGVRAGAITPTIEDENYFRAKAGLPAISAATRDAWSKESVPGVRRPITLTQTDGSMAAPAPTAATIEE